MLLLLLLLLLLQVHSPTKPVLVFVASRRQTRLTALDLISLAAADERPTQFLRIDPDELMVSVGVGYGGRGRSKAFGSPCLEPSLRVRMSSSRH
jgi:hypothetical protein